jgi:hypothetical protein
MKFYLPIIFILFSSSIYSQTGLTGKVVDRDNKPVDYFNVMLLSPKDSVTITGGTFFNGKFQFDKLKAQSYLLKITDMEYKDYLNPVILTNGVNTLPVIVLQTKEMNEVTVTAHRPTIQSKADRTIVTVEGSILGNTINGMDMLLKTHGLIKDAQGNISVAGKGTPVFYIDGREVRSMDEVKMLNPQNIMTIEIIDNPSAAYYAEGHEVVLINTIKRTDQYSVRLGGDFTQSRRESGNAFVEGVIRSGIITTNLYYNYEKDNNKTFEDDYRYPYPNDLMSTNASDLSSSKEHSYRLSTDIAFSPKQSVTVQSDGLFSSDIDHRTQFTQFSDPSSSNFYTYSTDKGLPYQINGTVDYNFTIDTLGQTLKAVADFTQMKQNDMQAFYNEIVNNTSAPFMNENDNRGLSKVYSVKADYTKPFNKRWRLEMGINYYDITSDNHTDLSGSTNLLQHNQTDEQNFAAYASLSANLNKKIELRLGLRGENTIRSAKNGGVSYLDTTQFNLFPSALVNYTCSENFTAGLSYTERISRPPFSYLDPSLMVDSLTNRKGNPTLKSTLIHSFELSFKFFHALSVRGGYRYLINPIYFLVYLDATMPQMTDVRIVNGDHTYSYFLTVAYDKSLFRWWSISLYGSIWTNSYPYNDNGVMKNNNIPPKYGSVSSTFNLPWSVTFDTGFNYNGKGSNGSIYNKAFSNLFASLQRSFLHKALSCTLSVNDLFRQSITHQQSVLDGKNLNVFDQDSRYVSLSVSYQIGKSSYQYHSKSADQTERQRIR